MIKINCIFKKVLNTHTAGNPEKEEEIWTYLNQEEIVELMNLAGVKVSRWFVKQLLKKYKYVKRKSQKEIAGGSGANRNEQFANISEKIADFKNTGEPYIFMDTKKKEMIGKYSRGNDALYGTSAEQTNDHDFKGKSTQTGIPHGIYDEQRKHDHIMIGNSRDTGEFACDCIRN
ncbi:MAG: hypothetical protein ACJAT4_003061 [Granulosicoccus sp.]|jgi:hypothetical protein